MRADILQEAEDELGQAIAYYDEEIEADLGLRLKQETPYTTSSSPTAPGLGTPRSSWI